MGIDFTGRGRLRGRALSDGRFTSMLRTVYHHLGDSWKWAHEASDFAASLFYSSISGVSKWFFPQAPSKLSTQTFKPVHNLGNTDGLSVKRRIALAPCQEPRGIAVDFQNRRLFS